MEAGPLAEGPLRLPVGLAPICFVSLPLLLNAPFLGFVSFAHGRRLIIRWLRCIVPRADILFFCAANCNRGGRGFRYLALAGRHGYLTRGHSFVTFLRAGLSETDFRQGSTFLCVVRVGGVSRRGDSGWFSSISCGVIRTGTPWLCWQHRQLALGRNEGHCPHRTGYPLCGLRVGASRHLVGAHREGPTNLVLYIGPLHSQTAGRYQKFNRTPEHLEVSH